MYLYTLPKDASYKQTWLGIVFKKNKAHLFFNKTSPSEIVQHILARATKYKALTFEQARGIAEKACEKYSESPSRTLTAVCPWEYRKLTMFRGKWDMTEIYKRMKAEHIAQLSERAIAECVEDETPYCIWPKRGSYDRTFWEKSIFELIDEQVFLRRELPEDVCGQEFKDEKGLKRLTPIGCCYSCKRLGGKKKVRFYGWKKTSWNFGYYCISCWNKLRPIWKVENEWTGIKSLANKLEREAKQHDKAN